MRIQFKTEGGVAHFPGLSQPVSIDRDQLPEQEAKELEQLVAAARFFDLPTRPGAVPRGAADYRRYTITVEAEGRRHTVEVVDPVTDPVLQRLLTYLQAKVRALRRAAQARTAE